MKATQRSVLSTAGFVVALAALVAPAGAGAQRVQQPGPDTKRVLVTAFRGDPEGGVKTADEIRNRIAGDFSIKQLMPISKKDIDATLLQSGYKPDSALSPNDIKELAKIMRADEVIDGTVTRHGNGFTVNARMFLPRDVGLSQPLGVVETNDFGDAAKQIVHEYDLSRSQLKPTQDCENGIRDGKIPVAIAAARAGIAAYPKGTLARLCLASAFQKQKTTADSLGPWRDSVLSVTKQTIALDKSSRIAYQLQYDAYKAKNDTVNLVPTLLGYMASDPTNSALREQVIAEVIQLGKADVAVPIAKQLVADNPGDPNYARLYWLVLRAARNYKESVPAGVAYVALDSTAADTNYYFRQIADLAADSMYAKAAEFAATGAARFPKNSALLIQQASYERRAGQLPAARATVARALQVDPKVPGANFVLAQIANDAGMPDSVVKYAKADFAADPTAKERDAQLLLNAGQLAYKAAAASKKIDDYKRAITLLGAADDINPSAPAKFFQAYSAYGAFTAAATELPKSKSCTEARAAGEYLTIVQTKMMGGGAFQPAAAQQVLTQLPEYQKYIDQATKAYCKGQ